MNPQPPITAMNIETRSEHGAFGGRQGFYTHASQAIGLPMNFSVFVPPQAQNGPVPVLYYLAGLTCTEETFMIKGGAQRLAAQHGLMLVTCDTSPRGAGIAGEDESWDFGTGAGFYLDATQAPWLQHYRMQDYVVNELPKVIASNFPASSVRGIFGHSMGGHGALTLALRNPDVYRSVSAFAPICAPMLCPWGQKAFPAYLGDDQRLWAQHDASQLMRAAGKGVFASILIDQGEDDKFLHDGQLLPEEFEKSCAAVGQKLTLRRQPGYDHGYYFISTFMEDHLAHHAALLLG